MKKTLIMIIVMILILSSVAYGLTEKEEELINSTLSTTEELKALRDAKDISSKKLLRELSQELLELENEINDSTEIETRDIFLLIEKADAIVEDLPKTEETVVQVNKAIEKIRTTARRIVRESLALKEYNISKEPDNITALPTSQKVTVDGEEVNFRGYNINGNNYIMLRDVAYIFKGTEAQFEVGWNGEKRAISLTTGNPYSGEGVGFNITTPHIKKKGLKSNATIYKNGELEAILGYIIDGNTYFKLRDLGKELNIGVYWDSVNKVVVLKSSGSSYIENDSEIPLKLVAPITKEEYTLPKDYKTEEDFVKLFLYMGVNNLLDYTVNIKDSYGELVSNQEFKTKPQNAYSNVFDKYPEYYSFADSMSYKGNCYKNYSELEFSIKSNSAHVRENIGLYRKSFFEEVDTILNSFIENGDLTENMTEFEQAKFLYNWIIEYAEYDHSFDDLSYTGYGLIANNKAVCQGYTATYNLMLKKLGISSYGIPGLVEVENTGEYEHIWTIAYLDGKRYHIDTTWGDQGDPIWNKYSLKYFAISGDEISDTHTWDRNKFGN